jgi:hypothetical protein
MNTSLMISRTFAHASINVHSSLHGTVQQCLHIRVAQIHDCHKIDVHVQNDIAFGQSTEALISPYDPASQGTETIE